MKKWLKGFAVGLLALSLAACSDTTGDAKPEAEDTNKSKPAVEDKGEQTKVTIEEVLEKAQESSEKIESMHAKMDIKQSMTISSLGQDIESDMAIEMDMVQEPLQMYQVMKIDTGEAGVGEVEMYMTGEGFFMNDPTSDTWMKLPADLFEDMSAGADPTLDLEELMEFAEDFTLTENDKEYILTLTASGEKFTELVQDQLSSMTDMEDLESLEEMTIHQLDYELFIDKKSFDMIAFNLVMDMEMGIEGESIRIAQDMKAQISQINDIKEIIVPQEVLDSAVEQ